MFTIFTGREELDCLWVCITYCVSYTVYKSKKITSTFYQKFKKLKKILGSSLELQGLKNSSITLERERTL